MCALSELVAEGGGLSGWRVVFPEWIGCMPIIVLCLRSREAGESGCEAGYYIFQL